MDKNEVMKILETAKDKNGEVPMRLVRQAFEKLPESCKDTISRQAAIDALDMAIERYGEIAEKYRKKADIERNDYMDMRDNAYEAQQLAQWLNELKYLRKKIEQITIKPEQRWIPCGKCIHADGKHRWCKFLDRTINEDYFCYWAVPSAQPEGWLEQNKDKILRAGMEGREIDFRIGGRLFSIREKAQ